MPIENQATETVGYVSTSTAAAETAAYLGRAESGARRVRVHELQADGTARRVQVGSLPGGKPSFQVSVGSPRPIEEPMLRFFGFTHLPAHLQDVSKPFHDLAETIVQLIPRNAERTVALRKLVESKDAAVRAVVFP